MRIRFRFISIFVLACLALLFFFSQQKERPQVLDLVEARELRCSRFFDFAFNFTENEQQEARTYTDPEVEADLPMNCEAIKQRSYFQEEDLYPEEREFPLAFARAVYKDYRFIEMELAASYAPQNFYCYALDAKSSIVFHKRMDILANCFPNVFLAEREFEMDSSGHNMSNSLYECIKLLAKKERDWKYLLTLQNHDVQLKTNQELIQIFKWFDGANEVAAVSSDINEISNKFSWTFEELHLFKDESWNLQGKITFIRGGVQSAVSRQFVDFIVENLDLTRYLEQLNSEKFGVDEYFLPPLNANEAIGAPGGYTTHCWKEHKKEAEDLVKLAYWARTNDSCPSGKMRHHVCIFGVESLLDLSDSVYLFANKMLPDQDFGALLCWHEKIWDRTHRERGIERLQKEVYLNLPQVRYNRERKQLGDKFDVKNFNCTSRKDYYTV